MSLRLARPGDVMRLLELLKETHEQSRYHGWIGLDEDYARKALFQATGRNGNPYAGGFFVMVEEVDGEIEAFIWAGLDRVYLILAALVARDLFLIATDKAGKFAAPRLIGAFIQWAEANPNVAEIELTHTDVTPQSERMGGIYEKMGFKRFGAAFRRVVVREEKAAA